MSVYLVGLVWVVGVGAAAGTISLLMRRIDRDPGDEDTPSVGSVFTLVGGLQAVLMVFVLIALFDAAETAWTDSYREADSLVALSWASESLPEPSGTRIHEVVRAYATTVIDHEWPRMQAGEQTSGDGWARLDELRIAIEQTPTTDDWQRDRKTEAADQLWQVYQARQDRLNASGGGVSLVMWFALTVGSVITIVLAYLYRGSKLVTHIVVMSTLAATIALLLFAIYQLQNPFSGGAEVGPDAFRAALLRLD